MKKYITLLIILFLCSSYAQKRNYNIGILLDHHTEEVTPLLNHLKKQIKAVVGEDATINFPSESTLINNSNIEKASENYNILLNNNTNIILAFGIINNKVISSKTAHKKPTILFGAVNQDLNAIDLNKKTSGIDNFTYLIDSQSFKADLTQLKNLTNFKTVGVIIEDVFTSVLPIQEAFNKISKELNINYKLIPYKTINDITQNLNNIDAVYLASGFFLKQQEIQQLADAFINNKLPSFTNSGIEDVKNGLFATLQGEDNLEQFSRRISLIIEAYIGGTPLSKMPVFIEYSPRLTINYNTAEATGVPIKYSLITTTDFVGEFKNSLSQKQYNLLEVINAALDKNLSLQAAKKDVELREQDIKTAKSNYLPSLTAAASGTYTDPNLAEISGGQNPEFQTAGNLTLQQTVFSEAANANINIQKNLQKAQQENFNTDQLNTIFNASNAYFNTLILKANAQIQLQNLNLTKKNLQIARQNFEAGKSGKSDLLRFRSQMAQNTQSMVVSGSQLEQSFIALNQLINNPIATEIDIENVELDQGIFKEYNYKQLTNLLDDPTLREPFIEFLIEEAKNNAPELKALGYNLEATERNIKLNGSGRFLPTVALQGQYNSVFSRSGIGSTAPLGSSFLNTNYNVGLNVSIPILNKNQTNINRQIAIIQKDQLNINKENTELSIAANIRNSVLNLINEVSNIELSKVSEASAKEALELTQTSYSNGAVTIIQLIDAQNNYLNAQLSRTNAVYNYLINALQLERNLGYFFLLKTTAENDQFTQRFLEFTNNRN